MASSSSSASASSAPSSPAVASPRTRPPRTAIEIPLLAPRSPRVVSSPRPSTQSVAATSFSSPSRAAATTTTTTTAAPPPTPSKPSASMPPSSFRDLHHQQKQQQHAPSTSSNIAGMLRVEVISARNLHAAVLGSLLKWTPNYSNPYVVVTLQRDEFTTTTKDKSLNPTWKEMGLLKVPLPTDQELLQTAGMHRNIHGTSGSGSGDGAGKIGGAHKLHGGGMGGKNSIGSTEFHACYPQLHVQVYHKSDDAQAASPSRTAQQLLQPQQRRASDKLIGEVIVPVLPCVLSTTSSSRGWYNLLSDEHPEAGQIQLAMHYDVGGLEPAKGDIVRLVGFGGMEYYSKLVNANARLEVVDVFQDQVFAQCKSLEGWMLGFEFHHNLLFVVRRPSMLKDAHSQFHGQISRVRHSPLATQAHRVWQAIPSDQRQQLNHLYKFVVFSGGTMYNVVTTSVQTTLHDGVHAGVTTCVNGSSQAVHLVSHEAAKLLWNDPNGPSAKEEMIRELEGGPKRGRGKIVHAFAIVGESFPIRADGVDAGEVEEEKTEENLYEFIVDEDDEEEEDEEEVQVDEFEEYEVEGKESTNAHDAYDDEEKTCEEEDDEDTASSDKWAANCPDQLICPITGCPMLDPVVAADGHSYEREAILQWFAVSNKSPMTGAQMATTQVFPNFTLRKLSEDFQAKMKAAK